MSDHRIKKYDDFMTGSNMRRFMSHLVVEGQIKTWFFGKSKSFELHIYYTPVKQVIMEIKNYSELPIEDLNLPFKKGEHIQVVKDWAQKNNHKITVDISRFEN